LGPLVCLSLLSVYHHHYDAISLFGPAILYLSMPRRRVPYLIVMFVVPVVLFAGLYQVEQTQLFIDRLFGDGSSGVMKLLGVVSVNIAFVASLLLLNDFIRARTVRPRVPVLARDLETSPRTAFEHALGRPRQQTVID